MPAGRPTLKTPELVAELCGYLKEHISRRGACGLVGISEMTLSRWLSDDPEFCEQIARAEAESERDLVRTVASCTDVKTTNPQPAEWICERRHPHQWRPKSDVNLSGKVEIAGLAELSRLARKKNRDEDDSSEEVNTPTEPE